MEPSKETARRLQQADPIAMRTSFEPVREPACRFLLLFAALERPDEPLADAAAWAHAHFEDGVLLCLRRIRRFGLRRDLRSWFVRILLNLLLGALRARESGSGGSRLPSAVLALRLARFGDHDGIARLAGVPLERVRAHLVAARLRQIETEIDAPQGRPNALPCPDARWHLLVDDEIFGREAREVSEHVTRCASCGGAVTAWREIERRTLAKADAGWSRLSGLPFVERVAEQMAQEPDEAAEREWVRACSSDHPRTTPGRGAPARSLALVLVCLAIAVLVGVLLRR